METYSSNRLLIISPSKQLEKQKRTLVKGPWHATRCGVISCHKPFWKLAPYDIIRGRKWACPPRRVLDRSVHQPTRWTIANAAHLSVTHLGGHAHLWCHKRLISKKACNGQSHHTWWRVMATFKTSWHLLKHLNGCQDNVAYNGGLIIMWRWPLKSLTMLTDGTAHTADDTMGHTSWQPAGSLPTMWAWLGSDVQNLRS